MTPRAQAVLALILAGISPLAWGGELPPIPDRQTIDERSWTQLPPPLRAADPAERIHGLRELRAAPAQEAAWLEIVLRTDPSERVRRVAAAEVTRRAVSGSEVDWNTDTLRRAVRDAPTVGERVEITGLLCAFAPGPVLGELLGSGSVAVRLAAIEGAEARRSEPAVLAELQARQTVETDAYARAALGRAVGDAPPVERPAPPVERPASPPPVVVEAPPAPSPAPAVASAPTARAPTERAPTDRAPTERAPTDRGPADRGPAEDKSQSEDLFVLSMTGYGGYLGGMGAWLFGEATETEDSQHTWGGVGPGAALGAGVGLGTGLLLSSRVDAPRWSSAVYSSGTVVGGVTGFELGMLLIPDDAPAARERRRSAGLAGTMAGAGLSMLMTREPRALEDVLRVDYTTALGLTLGASLPGVFDQEWSAPARAGAQLGGMLAGGGVGLLVNRADLGPAEPTTALLGYAQGLWVGGNLPSLVDRDVDETRVLSGLGLGLALGYADTTLMHLGGDPDGRSLALQSVGVLSGNALGAGVSLIAQNDDRQPPALAIGALTGVAGQAVGYLTAPRYTLSKEDAYLMATLGAWTAYQAAGWGVYTSEVTSGGPQALGVSLATGGVGVLGTVALAPVVDATPPQSIQLLASGGWGTWTGAWIARMAELDAGPAWLMMMGGGNVALAGTGAAEALGWSPDWGDVAAINGVGLLGAAGGGLVGVLFLYQDGNWDPLIASTLVGSGLGLAGGGIIAARSERDDGAAAALGLPELRGLPGVGGLSVSPWTDEVGAPGLFVEARLSGW